MPRTWLLLAALLAAPLSAVQGPPGPLRAVRVQAPVKVDGLLDEAAWAQAPAATGFTRQWPDFGEPSRLRTEVRVLYDDAALYIGARMHQPGGARDIVRRVHRRDQDSQGDWFGVFLDTLHDRRSAVAFFVNAGGVQRDGVLTNDGNVPDASWDGVWESAVRLDGGGWTAEIRIPLSLLRIPSGGGPLVWGINFQRGAQGPIREQSFWFVPPRTENAWVSRFPELVGLEGLVPAPRREWIPFLSARRKFETREAFEDRAWTRAAGLDARLALNTHSQVDLSIRPDFGQVEVDQAVLNLSTLETFFPEKRPFFLEGADLFQTLGPQLFYSRRIGRSLSAPDLDPGSRLLERPLAADIAAAAKYTARFDGRLSLGFLAAGVEPGRAKFEDAQGRRGTLEVAPYTSYAVLRAQQLLGLHGSFLGAFASHAREAGPAGREAVVAALDGAVASADRSNRVEWALEHSRQGPRTDPAEGWYGRIRNVHTWTGNWSLDTRLINAGRRFDPNDLGFFQSPDNRHAEFFLQKWRDRSLGPFRDGQLSLYGSVDEDQAGHRTHAEVNAQVRTSFSNFWGLWAGGGSTFRAEDDRELRTFSDSRKKYLEVAPAPYLWAGFDTAGNKPWYLRFQYNAQRFTAGPSQDFTLQQTIKPTERLDLQLDSAWTRDRGELRYLGTFGSDPGPFPGQSAGTPVVGFRRLNSFNQVIRVGYAFTPQFTLQAFTQWLIASWAFRDLQHYAGDRTLAAGLPPGTAQADTAFSYRTWNLNLIGRWEFRPGSTLFLVYTHGTRSDTLLSPRASIRPLVDFTDLRHLPSDDVVQVKLSWLFR
ncbi:MAG: carbohydrate binding family 9 domain-containing protein [Acidobacteria bacterium]|nr:carbohydrate binding family 9 domain-containing protein [Acidobacteriota bacterium]